MTKFRSWTLGVGGALALSLCPASAEQVVISEIMYHPADDRPEYIEISNITSKPLDMVNWRLRDAVDYDFPDFSPSDPQSAFLKPYERIVVSGVDPNTLRAAYGIPPSVRIFGPWSGSLDNAGERITLKDKNGVVLCSVAYGDRHPWPLAADGTGHTLVLIDPDNKIDDWRNWTFSRRPGGTPGTEPIQAVETPIPNPEVDLSQGVPVVDLGSVWRYNDRNQDLGTAWRNPAYDDSDWEEGPSLFGYENAALPAPGIQTPFQQLNQPTYYLRIRFVYDGPVQNAILSIDQVLDDGAVYYLNGQEIARSRMPAGTITFETRNADADKVLDAQLETDAFTINNPPLVRGTNVLAVEVHQTELYNADLVFGCRLKIAAPTQSSVVINEVAPGGPGAGFIEFYNPGSSPINLRNYYLSDDPGTLTKRRILEDVVVPAGGLASVGFAEYGFALRNPVAIYLTQPDGVTPVTAIRAALPMDGRSAGRKPTGAATWFVFSDPTRNAPNGSRENLVGVLHLNEVHFSASNTVDWVELYNSGFDNVPLTGLVLGSDPLFGDALDLQGVVPAGGYASVDCNFPVNDGEIRLYLATAGRAVIDARRLRRSALGDALQVYPAGSGEWYGATVPTRDAPNDPPRQTDIVINEIMYDPPSDEIAGEYIELYNRGTNTVDLSNWRFTDGITFTFPVGTLIPAGGYLVVAADAEWMRSAYGPLPGLGNFNGRLSDNGERVRLEDQWGNLVDEVDYKPGGSWPNFANGDGTSMELRNPWMDNSLPSAWADSDESEKAPFRHYSYSDVYRQLRAEGSITDYRELHLHLVGDAHVVLRNIQVQENGTGPNLIKNGDRKSTDGRSANGWLAQGTHYASHIEGDELHLIADGHGDNRANRVEIDVTDMEPNRSYTVSFDARWIYGPPRLIVQTWDHSIATSIPLEVPLNLGTPGAQNSRYIPTPAPQVDALQHVPAVPAPGQTVRVMALVTSALPSPQVRLFHRLDNSTGSGTWQSKPMFDDGRNGGDEVAGDGIYTAELTEYRTQGQIAQFYVEAEAASQSSRMPKWGPERPAMFVVDSPTNPGDLRTMRFIISELDRQAISNQDSPTGPYGYAFPRLSNHYFNMTLVINEQKVIYNCELRNSGSPWTRGGSLDRGKFKLPKDHLFRGKQKYSFDNDAGGSRRHHDRIVRYWLYLLGHPSNEDEFVQVEINHRGTALRLEVEPVGNDLLDRFYPNGRQGELYRIDDEWWFRDDWGRSSRNADWSYKGTDNPGRYRTEWMKRTREAEDDFSALIGLFRKVNSSYSQVEIDRIVDGDYCMLMAAVRGYIYDWDSFSLNRGKNGYFYRRPTDGRFMFLHWDSDLAFQDANNSFYNGMNGFRPYMLKPYNFRKFKHYLAVMIEQYTRNSPRMEAWLQAEEDASTQYNLSFNYRNWFNSREQPALNLLGAALTTPFRITTNNGQPLSTSEDTVNLAGQAPLRVWRVEAEGHPEAQFAWTGETTWTLSSILLETGANELRINALDDDGNVLETATFTVTKAGNALPIMEVKAKPASWHLSTLDVLEMDPRESWDPDGTPLTFAWSADSPEVQLQVEDDGQASALFPRPGVYGFTVTGRDADGGTSAARREAAVYAPGDFSPFTERALEPIWAAENVTLRGHSWTGPYYSLTEQPGWLTLATLDDQARPINSAQPIYPALTRPLPARTDWTLETKLELRGQVFADYLTGLFITTADGMRYFLGIEDGTQLSAKRVTGLGALLSIRSTPMDSTQVTIRIQRSGNSLRFDQLVNDEWQTLTTIGLPPDTEVARGGIFVGTDNPAIIKVAFDYVLVVDPSATSDLRDNLRLTEIMYNPPGGSDYEYVELFNKGDITLDLTGAQFVNGIHYTFGPTLIAPGQYLVVVKNQAAFASRYDVRGLTVAPGEFAGRLDNAGETIELVDAQGNLILSVTYGSGGGWPPEADGQGSSLEAVDLEANPNDPANWRASPEPNGSPGRAGGNRLGTVVINEVLTHTDFPLEDAIELYNRTDQPVDISGWFLSDARSEPKKYRIPDGTVLPAGGYTVFYELDFHTNNPLAPFSLSSVDGDQVYLSAADSQGNLTGYQTQVEFGPAENGVSFGRYETSVGVDFPPLEARTFGTDQPATLEEFRSGTGAPNAMPKVGPVVINEIMYHPPDLGGTNDNVLDEFVELYNITDQTVELFDPDYPTNTWRLRGGADFDLPTGLTLPAHGYLVLVNFDPSTNATQAAAFRSLYGLPGNVPLYGPYGGKLSNDGEELRLLKPDTPVAGGPDMGKVPYVLVDLVRYSDAPPWPVAADGSGSALQRRRPHEYGNDPVNWKAGDPTPARANVTGASFSDADRDGLPDSYEIAQSLNRLDPSDASADADGDGKSNYEEFLDETDPHRSSDRLVAPTITTQPNDLAVAAGNEARFEVTAEGSSPLFYQWRFNGTAIPGATNAALVLPQVRPGQAGEYNVAVYNTAGFVLSRYAKLQVDQPLAILAHPLSQLADVGGTVTFNVFAVGTGALTYQWLFNGAPIAGATDATLTLTNLQPSDSGAYSVRVTDAHGSMTSAEATLDVLSPPVILEQPQPVTAVAWNDVTFSVVAGGQGPLTYQWKFNGANLVGETNAILYLPRVEPTQAGFYSVEVFNPVGSVTSTNVELRILIPARIRQHPQSQMARPGESVTFTVVAESNTPMTYQWFFNDEPIPGATTTSLTLTNIQEPDGGNYFVEVTDTVGTVRSEIAVLTVLVWPEILVPPLSQSVAEGGNLTLSILTKGALPMGYRLRRNGATVANVALMTHQAFFTFEPVTPDHAGIYTIVITNAAFYRPGLLSQAATVTVLPDTDGDGMPDEWETAHGFQPNAAVDGQLDADNDGLSNADEYRAGTDPHDWESCLRVEALEIGDEIAVRFTARSNLTYTVQFTDELVPTRWQKLADLVAYPTNYTARVVDPHGKPGRYYRVVTPRQPDEP